MNAYDHIVQKLQAGQTVYLLNDFYSTVIKCIPGTTHYKAKRKGGDEYDIDRSTDLVCETLEDPVEITEQEYNEY
jgi:hypothetical protein